jgi:hypothetical protein
MPTPFSFLCPLLCSCLMAMTLRAETTFRSGPAQVALIELYTSEGCSSCPPAEAWLGNLRPETGLWRDFVPVAFHVNYWDRLGWRDVLASKAFTDREYAYAAAWNASSVYTPCFVRNGAEWRPPAGSLTAKEMRGAADAGILTLTWEPETHACRIDYTPPANAKAAETARASKTGFDASVALLGGGIVNAIRKGENAGRELRHEFAALRLETTRLQRTDSGTWSARVTLPPRADITAARFALAAWITQPGELMPRQAVGGWLK